MERFSELARLRRSMRKFTDEPLEQGEIDTILRAALMAPSSKGLRSFEFVVVTRRETIAALSRCKAQGADFLSGAAAAVVVAGNEEVSDAWIEDASVASTIMLFEAEDLGLGSCWVQIRERKDADGGDAEENVRRLLGMPGQVRVLSIIALGHKGMERKPQNEDKLRLDKVHREKW